MMIKTGDDPGRVKIVEWGHGAVRRQWREGDATRIVETRDWIRMRYILLKI